MVVVREEEPPVTGSEDGLEAEEVRTAEPMLPPGPDRLTTVPANVVDLIPKAQALLADDTLEVKFCGATPKAAKPPAKGKAADKTPPEKPKTEATCLCDYKLAVTDAKGAITLVDAYQGQEESSPPGYSIRAQITPGYERACGSNPTLAVSHPPGQTVLAVRTVVKDGKRTTRQAVFTPFTDELNVPELRQKGLDYWWGTVKAGRDQLAANKVPSEFRKGELVTDVIPDRHVFLLGIIENIGTLSAFGDNGSDEARLREINAVLVMYGANGSNAFNWRVSSANARGPVQFTPTIYESLRKQYPAAEIPKDFVTGTSDHRVSVRAAYIHSDEEFRPLQADWRTALPEHPLLFGLYLASGYNGNVRWANKGLHACTAAEWYGATCSTMKGETIWYQRKYIATDAMFFLRKVRARIVEELSSSAEDDAKTE
ncbi:hypothetical protein EBS80_01745 [bacterium]|nr:hypothetical protein [bacterium]